MSISMSMTVALFQGPAQADAKTPVAHHLTLMEQKISEAAKQGASVIIFPELYLTGYHIGRKLTHQLAETIDGPSVQRVKQMARQHHIAVIYGYPERDGDKVYNAAILINAAGEVATNYRKTHLYGEIDKQSFSPGDTSNAIAEINGWKVGLLICYDVEFPENVRALALQGVDFIAVPTALMHPYYFVAKTMISTRAYENQLYLAYVNRVGHEGELHYYGMSCLAAPDGETLIRAGSDESLCFATVDRARMLKSRAINTYFEDRRPALYGNLSS